MLVIIETPYSMRTCRLQVICTQYFPHKFHVSLEYFVYGSLHVFRFEDSNLEKTEQEDYKVKLVSSSIVNSLIRAKRLFKVVLDLWYCPLKSICIGYTPNELIRSCQHLVHPYLECLVSKSHRLLNWWHLVNPC